MYLQIGSFIWCIVSLKLSQVVKKAVVIMMISPWPYLYIYFRFDCWLEVCLHTNHYAGRLYSNLSLPPAVYTQRGSERESAQLKMTHIFLIQGWEFWWNEQAEASAAWLRDHPGHCHFLRVHCDLRGGEWNMFSYFTQGERG